MLQAQYIFLHHVMLEALLLNDVTIPASANFPDELRRLQKPQQPDKKSLINKQFEVGALYEPVDKLLLPVKKIVVSLTAMSEAFVLSCQKVLLTTNKNKKPSCR